MNILTLQALKEMKPDTIFAKGVSLSGFRWVAVRGGIEDWAIYVGTFSQTADDIKLFGDKVYDPAIIRGLVPCDDEAFRMYRY
jgi:hypothetical protein